LKHVTVQFLKSSVVVFEKIGNGLFQLHEKVEVIPDKLGPKLNSPDNFNY
jgi:hypothetical protein